ncbi:hypothetical protein FACS1894186_2330 [Alphaproteobacteria bacterium]|nr:hypothetical protein FACS1894186_2330 [Alphaproteobacteria bacterium]
MDTAPRPFAIAGDFVPSGDQPEAIAALTAGLREGKRDQVLLGVTGSGKTFTMANVIASLGRPALIMAHNKTLAAQLYSEMKECFPNNAVEYFVSYYDYYQPEAYMPRTDTFIEKDSAINEQIDRLRHAATQTLLTRRDAIIVASVSCIYGLGSPDAYSGLMFELSVGQRIDITELAGMLVSVQFKRNDVEFKRGAFRINGDVVDIFPTQYEDTAWRLSFFGDEIEAISEIDALTGVKKVGLQHVRVFPASHHVASRPAINRAIEAIRSELAARQAVLKEAGKLIELQRITERTNFDLEMLVATGYCKGIENYSRFLTGRAVGDPPPTLFEYLPKDALLFVDESHVSVPQIGAMYNGDARRKETLVEYGFRLPSCRDNRPLKFAEWDAMRPQTIYMSATPAAWELERAGGKFVEQIIRPTGLTDPEVAIRPVSGQVDDLMAECRDTAAKGQRVLATVLTKKMAEMLTEYLDEHGVRVRYMHSDVETLERLAIIRDLRLGKFDVLVGINLLREGLDIPECGLVAILDADKEGFLRSATSLIQTIGRAARNVDGHVIMYADKITRSIEAAMVETNRRREKQIAFNKAHGITPQTIVRRVADLIGGNGDEEEAKAAAVAKTATPKEIDKLERAMHKAAALLDFEEAARLRDELRRLQTAILLAPID